MPDIPAIRHSPWIKSRNVAWEHVLHLGQRLRYCKNEFVGGNGEHVNNLHYLYKGRIKLCRITSCGLEKILFHIEEKNLFGEVPFWSEQQMDSAFIAEDHCEVYAFSRQCIKDEIMPTFPFLILNMLDGMANKAHILGNQACDIADLATRVSKVLVYVADRDRPDVQTTQAITVRGISQQELASMLGVHRVTINHAVGQLKRLGIIGEMTKSTLVILDYPRLLDMASK